MSALRRVSPDQLPRSQRSAVDRETRATALAIVDDVRSRGDEALREHAERLGDLEPGEPLVIERDELDRARQIVGREVDALLERTADRIRTFAEAQRAALRPIDVPVAGGRAGHTLEPVASAGCYAPGGRFPLPSSVLMTGVTARTAGVARVFVASPRPAAVTLAAAAVAGADRVLAVGGAQAVAALAYGTESVPPVDFVCGPGNRWVTAAKQIVFGDVGIDGLAGPSELVVVADGDADAAMVAADLLAQAEHDVDALPVLVTTSPAFADAVDDELTRQLTELGETCAAESLQRGFAVVARDLNEALEVADALAPEHLALHVPDPAAAARRVRHCGALFLGSNAAEALGDYGAGPNHVLPTGRGARFQGGLSVLDLLRVRTWLASENTDEASSLARDAARLARLEGLEAHARSAELRASVNEATAARMP